MIQNRRYVRSGKVVGENQDVLKRCQEHTNSQGEHKVSSKFYDTYRGRWDVVRPLTGLTFTMNLGTALRSCFHWSRSVNVQLMVSNYLGHGPTVSYHTRQLHMLGYFMELVLELCMNTESVLSQAPGFEELVGYKPDLRYPAAVDA